MQSVLRVKAFSLPLNYPRILFGAAYDVAARFT
jgi:hypothetical protein